MKIELKEGAKLPRVGQRRFTREEAIEIKKQLNELEKAGKIRKSRSESAVTTLFVEKADKTKRWCMDLRPVNKVTKTDSNKSTLQDTSRERLRGAKYFTRLDMRDGYHHLRIRKGDEHKTAFLTEYGLFEWTVMCFGLKNAPAEFARYMSDNLREFLNDFVVVYFDDIIIFSEDLETHWEKVRKVLTRIREKKINLKLKKCEFAVTKTSFLGHIVDGESTSMQEEKVRSILEWPTPRDCKGIEEFRGMAGYYRQYIEHFSEKAEPLNEVVRKKIFKWEGKEKEAFEEIKNSYRKRGFLLIFNEEKQIWVHADASDYAIGGEISQLDKNGKRRPVLFYSRKLLPAEKNYTTADKEMLAIVQIMKKYRHYLQGTKYPVIVKSDHRNLQTFMTTKTLNARQARWAEELSNYDFVIEHIKGKENKIADALSRREDYRNETEEKSTTQMLKEEEGNLVLNPKIQLKMISMSMEEKELLKEIREETRRSKERPEMEEDEEGIKRFRGMIFVPKKMEERTIQRYHDNIQEGHPGIARTIEKLQRQFYFPGMFRKVKRYINKCDSCMRNKISYQKPEGKMQIEKEKATRPWERISIDVVDMPETKNPYTGNVENELLVVVDTFSKQTILIPTKKNANTEEMFHLLWERIFAVFGIPRVIISDRDRIFRTERWANKMKDIGAIQILSTAHHQQTDGQTERKIQEMQAFYRHYLDYEQKNWNEITPIIQYAMNDAQSTATGKTPNFVTFGTERINGKEKSVMGETSQQERMKIIHKEVERDLEWTEKERKRYYDQKRVESHPLKRGERVYLRRKTIGNKQDNIRTKRNSTKLDCIRLGPFEIEERMEYDNYKLKLPDRMKIHPIFHISLLTRTKNPATDKNIEAFDIEEYDVDAIIGKRTKRGITEYLVKWTGYGEDESTWEKVSNLQCPERVKEFELSRNRR
jgi:hypothetical protein